MACIVLPSETARLVYGYLVKENLNDIALQFLETSPYLTDCCQITKQGYNFNTKLFSKDLHELLQEYSNIHNLVNNKINILPKTTLLYKKIKLKCESLTEIIDLLLFWKYKYQKKREDSLTKDKPEPQNDNNKNFQNSTEQTSISNSSNHKINICSNNSVNEYNSNDNQENVCAENNFSQDESQNFTSEQEKTSDKNEVFNHSISFETAINSNLPDNPENFNATDTRVSVIENIESSEIQNAENCIKEITDMNVLMQSDGQCLSENAMEVDPAPSYEEENQIQSEGNIEIVRIETPCESESQTLDLYQDPLKGNEANNNDGNITEDSPVVFIDPSVGNFKISSDPNQIIVIPIDCYKSSSGYQRSNRNQNTEREEIMDLSANVDYNQENDFSYQVIAEEAAAPAQVPIEPTTSSNGVVKNSLVDSNIITADGFTSVPAASLPVPLTLPPPVQVLVPQIRERFRKILPREKKMKKTNDPAVVYVNVPTLNTDSTNQVQELQPQAQPEPKLKENNNNNNKRRSSKNLVNTRRRRTAAAKKMKSPGNRNLPNISTVTLDDSPLKEGDGNSKILESNDKTEADKAGEEKENKEDKAKSKIETPVVLTTRNLKRLSLSTPRRRSSHIRALEFETPPKTNDERKKSQTSPKVKVDQITVERKNVRNTLFKSPDLETVFKSPACLKSGDKNNENNQTAEENNQTAEPLNELSIPIATRSPKVDKLSETWDNLTGMSCVLDEPECNDEENKKKRPWDADLRSSLPNTIPEIELNEKKRTRKPEKSVKDNKKPPKKKSAPGKKCKSSPPMAPASASKISITAKRNTYSISENEEKSPVRPFQEDANLVTPFKYPETLAEESPLLKFRSVEETPFSKLLLENGVDIDLSLIPTPTFPPTPSILEELSAMSGTKYYSPSKDESKNKSAKITDYFKIDPSKTNKQETKETHEKIVSEMITKAREITGLNSDQEENQSKKRPCGGKMLSMHKMITIATSDKKLFENIPINDESSFDNSTINKTTIIENQTLGTPDVKIEMEEKRKRTIQSVKGVKENLTTKNKTIKRYPRKRKGSGGDVLKNEKKLKLEISSDTTGERLTESDESGKKDAVIVHSTPYAERRRGRFEPPGPEKQVVANSILSIIPKFEDHMNVFEFPELPSVWRKKFYYLENFLKLTELNEFLKSVDCDNQPKLDLKSDLVKAFKIFYSWAKELNCSEMDASDKTKGIARDHLVQFNKIKIGLKSKSKKSKKDLSNSKGSSSMKNHLDAVFKRYGEDKSQLSDEEDSDCRKKESDKKKEEEVEDGVASTLPLKKRKANVQPLEKENSVQETPEDLSTTSNENMNVMKELKGLDLEDVLFQIHKQPDV